MEHIIYAAGVIATIGCFVITIRFELMGRKQKKLSDWIEDEESQYWRSRRRTKKNTDLEQP